MNDLQHWGIPKMKWGVRRFQNPDGSLTPEGRLRYGVGPARNLYGVNDGSSLSNEELREMTKRYQSQANYYKARNDFIYQEKQFRENTTPKKVKKEHTFLKKVIGEPVTNFLAKNVEFGLRGLGYSFMENRNPNLADAYMQYMFNAGNKKDEKKDDNKDDKKKDQKLYSNKNDQRSSSNPKTNSSSNNKDNRINKDQPETVRKSIFDDDGMVIVDEYGDMAKKIADEAFGKPYQDYVDNTYKDEDYKKLIWLY